MPTRPILSTALLGLTLLGVSAAQAKPLGLKTTLSTRQICGAFGAFTYTRALERDAGQSYATTLEQTLLFDLRKDATLAVRQYHQDILKMLYAFPKDTPDAAQAFVEAHCREQMDRRD